MRACGGLRRLGAARPRADAAVALLPLSRLLSGQCGRLFVLRIAVRLRVLPGPVPPDRAGLRTAWCWAATAPLGRHAVRERPARRRPRPPGRRADPHGRPAAPATPTGRPGGRAREAR